MEDLPANPAEKQTKRLDGQNCAILINHKLGQVIGGKNIGWPYNHRSQFINSRGGDGVSRPFVGFNIAVPRHASDEATYFDHNDKLKQDHFITLMLWHGSFTYTVEELPQVVRDALPTIMKNATRPADRVSAITLKLKDGHRAVLDGFGTPTTTARPADSAALFSGGKFGGVKPLLELAAQREFRIIIPDDSPQKHPKKWFLEDLVFEGCNIFDGYQTSEFSLPLYRTMIPELARPTEYAAKVFKFDNNTDCQIALEQGAAQDVYQLSEDVKEIRSRKMDSVWLRTTQGPPENCSEYIVLVKTLFTNGDKVRFEDSWDRSIGGGSAQLGVAFDEPPAPGPDDEDRDRDYWPAHVFQASQFESRYDLVIKVRRPTAADVGFQSRNTDITSHSNFDSFLNTGKRTQSVYLKFDDGVKIAKRRVNAVNRAFSQDGTSLVPAAKQDDSPQRRAEIAQLTHQARLLHLFKRDLFTGSGFFASLSPVENVDGLTAGLGNLALAPPTRLRVPVALPRTFLLRAMTQANREACLSLVDGAIRSSLVSYLESVRLGVFVIIGCAGSGKTQLLAVITTMLWMNRTIGKIYGSAPTNVAVTNFAMRCFGTMEIVAKQLPAGHGRRYLPVVVRGYTMKREIFAFLEHGRHPWVPAAEWDSIGQDSERDPYRSTPWKFRLSPAFWLWLTLKMPSNINMGTLPMCPRLAEVKKRIREDAKYRGFCAWVDSTEPLGISAIDDRGPRAVEELILDLLTQVVLAADIVVTTPHVSGDKQYAAFNRIAEAVVLDDAGVMLQTDALLVWGEGCRPCVMAGDEKQLPPTVMTMCHKDKMTGMATNSFAQLARVSVLEQLKRTGWPCFVLTRQHRIAKGGFDVAIFTTYKGISDRLTYSNRASLANVEYAAAVEEWLVKRFTLKPAPPGNAFGAFLSHPGRCVSMLVAGLGLKGSDFVVVTPYRAGRDQIQLALQDSNLPDECRSVKVDTIDSFQGGESTIVIFVLIVNAETGAQFVADPHRVCVGITRHKAALLVVGDIDTASGWTNRTHRGRGDGGQETNAAMSKKSAFGDLLDWFVSKRRMARVSRPEDLAPAVPSAQAPGWSGNEARTHTGMDWGF
ncbi:hypothetical protein QBC39DRAFT_380460 [Podospora conica]|nr:hypothetical protein QBC39DRAFT_380460 [Schizothecium conicum]